MALTGKDIKDLAHLARLGVDEDALEPLAADLSTVLHLVEQLQAIDTVGVEPMAHPGNASLNLRDDSVLAHPSRDALQAPAPQVEGGYFLVPRVIE
ncbi:MAG: Asp-tRNA(Asn)/Glu-tRNA(Gln) amidotransferase subunit GatC [Granulosicoccus sp.]